MVGSGVINYSSRISAESSMQTIPYIERERERVEKKTNMRER